MFKIKMLSAQRMRLRVDTAESIWRRVVYDPYPNWWNFSSMNFEVILF